MVRMRRLLLGACFLLACGASGEVFKDGETVCFLGDSITHGGRFHSYIYDYYLTRFPESRVRFVNAGVAGDSAGGAQRRLAEDVIEKKPSFVAIMLGMNDVGRGNYVAEPDAQKVAAQQRSLDSYRANMDQLIARIRREANSRILLITPSPFDQTVTNDRNNNQPGCNDGLARCAQIVREIGAKHGCDVVDFNGPMTAFNLEQQRREPTFTIIGGDRVHPGPEGHLMMAWLFLKAQGAPSLVSEVAIDGARGNLTRASNAEVRDILQKDGALHFAILEKALPFPVDKAARPLLGRLPIERDLNQEMLSVAALPEGEYELMIDGSVAGRYSSIALARGINLASDDAAPQFRQAQEVATLNERRRATEATLRDHAAVRWFLRGRQVDPDNLGAVSVFAETRMDKAGYYEAKVPGYLKGWEKRGETIDSLRSLEAQLFALRQPAWHEYSVRPVARAGTGKQ